LINGIIENLIAGFIATLCAAVLKKLWQFLKTGRSSHDSKTTKTYSAKLVKNQFFICLFAIPILMICALQLRNNAGMVFIALKFLLFIGVGFSILFAWGAFDAAFSFYPHDNAVDVPSNSNANDNTCKHPDIH